MGCDGVTDREPPDMAIGRDLIGLVGGQPTVMDGLPMLLVLGPAVVPYPFPDDACHSSGAIPGSSFFVRPEAPAPNAER